MIDMSTWKEMVVDVVDDLCLDPLNVRLDIPDGVPEADILQDLFTNEKALSLVESITKVGLLTHEVPIVLKRGGKLIVVEGNRRVAALKAIQNPYLVPDHQARITKFAQILDDRNTLRRITVKLAPTQDDADQLIAALHTGNQRVAWTPARQAAFFQAQLDAGKSPPTLIAHYPTVDVPKFIARSRILELFRKVDYDNPSLGDYARARRFPVSTLARLYENEKFLNLIGIQLKEATGEVTLTSSPETFKRIATKIIADIRNGDINTRTLNKTSGDRYLEYMDDLRDLLDQDNDEHKITDRERSIRDRFATTAPGNGSLCSPAQPDTLSKEKPKLLAKPRNYLNTDNLVVPSTFPASIHAMVNELSAINIERFPNATLDLLRTFLEKSIKAYADSVGEDIRQRSNAKGFVYLSHCLVWLELHFKETHTTQYIQPIQKVRGISYGFIGSKEHLDATNHNHLIVATSADVRASWAAIEPIIKAILKPT